MNGNMFLLFDYLLFWWWRARSERTNIRSMEIMLTLAGNAGYQTHTHTLTMAGLVDAVYRMIRTSFNVAVVCVRVMNARIEGRILNRIR